MEIVINFRNTEETSIADRVDAKTYLFTDTIAHFSMHPADDIEVDYNLGRILRNKSIVGKDGENYAINFDLSPLQTIKRMGYQVGVLPPVVPPENGNLEHISILISDDGNISINSEQSLNVDLYDLLRLLDDTLLKLSDHLRGINDPSIKTSKIKMVKTSVDALRCYLEIESKNEPVEIPREAARGVLTRLKGIEWKSVSSEANKWAQTITKILESWLS